MQLIVIKRVCTFKHRFHFSELFVDTSFTTSKLMMLACVLFDDINACVSVNILEQLAYEPIDP